jgi:hypothetical protein
MAALTLASTACTQASGDNPGVDAGGRASRSQPSADADPSLSRPRLSAEEINAMRARFMSCWEPPPPPSDAKNVSVEIRISANPDGTIKDARLVSARGSPEPYVQASAESALRAVHDPHCSAVRAPREKYEAWKTFVLVFAPSDAGPSGDADAVFQRHYDVERVRRALKLAPPAPQ